VVVSTSAARDDAARRARFEAVAAAVYEPLQRYLARRAPPEDAADTLAETLLVVWRRLDDVPAEPLPWCYGVARRSLANQRRGKARQLRLVERSAAHARTGAPAAVDPQESVEHLDPELDAAIAGLSATEREIVHLWAWERLEPREIADVLDLTPNAVSVALSRAKRKLIERLDRQDRGNAGHLRGDGVAGQEGDGR
jgi:RNA polymerase sigma-70 factor (ECF subfamily)